MGSSTAAAVAEGCDGAGAAAAAAVTAGAGAGAALGAGVKTFLESATFGATSPTAPSGPPLT